MICAECGQSFENEIDAVIQNHEPCATNHGPQPTDLQKLKAKIRSVVERLSVAAFENDTVKAEECINKLLELSEV